KIELVWNKRVVEIKGTERGTDHLVLEDTARGGRVTLAVGGVFIFVGFKPNAGLVEGHAKHDAGGYFITDERMMTSIPGLFAAGVKPVAIWLTHGHIDHVLGVPRLKADTGAPVYLHPGDRVLYDHVPEQASAFGMRAAPLPPPDRALAHGDRLRVGALEFHVR